MTSGLAMGGIVFILTGVLYVIGCLMSLVGSIWLLVRSFQTSVGWGLAVLFLPFANLVFAVKHWAAAKKPFLLSLGGVALIVVAVVLGLVLGLRKATETGTDEMAEARLRRAERTGTTADSGAPQSDREKMAALLADAGIDPANPGTFKGRTIDEMTTALGTPSATMKAGAKKLYIFQNCFEVESSDNGKTVSSVHYMGE